jgi:hypothetical protein
MQSPQLALIGGLDSSAVKRNLMLIGTRLTTRV